MRAQAPHGNCEPVTWRGVTYESTIACAAVAGVTRQTVGYHLRVHGNLDRLGVGQGNHSSHVGPGRIPAGPYPSLTALSRAAGLSPKTVQKWRREGAAEKLMAAMMKAKV